MKNITEEEFNALSTSDKPVMVDFYADWCGPCKAVAPVLEKLAEQHGEKAEFVKVNIDEVEDLPAKVGVRGIPTFIVFKGGVELARTTGSKSFNDLNAWFEQAIAG